MTPLQEFNADASTRLARHMSQSLRLRSTTMNILSATQETIAQSQALVANGCSASSGRDASGLAMAGVLWAPRKGAVAAWAMLNRGCLPSRCGAAVHRSTSRLISAAPAGAQVIVHQRDRLFRRQHFPTGTGPSAVAVEGWPRRSPPKQKEDSTEWWTVEQRGNKLDRVKLRFSEVGDLSEPPRSRASPCRLK